MAHLDPLNSDIQQISILYWVGEESLNKEFENLCANYFSDCDFPVTSSQFWNFSLTKQYDLVIVNICNNEDNTIHLIEQYRIKYPHTSILILLCEKAESQLKKLVSFHIEDFALEPKNLEKLTSLLSRRLKLLSPNQTELANNQTLDSQQARINELLMEREKFFSLLSHELKSPFNGILGLSEILVESSNDLSPEDKNEITKELFRASRKYFSLLSNILDWSRIQRDKIVIEPELIRIKELIDRAIDYMKPLTNLKPMNFNNTVPEDIVLSVDRNLTMNILLNLLMNGYKYSHPNSIIEIQLENRENSKVSISIQDQGIGFESSILEDIKAGNLVKSTPGTEDETGTGLGLFICNSIMKLQEGKLIIQNPNNQGSKVTLQFSLR